MGDAADHDVRKDFQLISNFISTKIAKNEKHLGPNELSAEHAAIAQAGLHVVFSLTTSLARIATALEQIEMNTRKNGTIQ